MGDADLDLVRKWIDGSPSAGHDWIAYWDKRAWADDIDHRAIEGAPDDVGPMIGREALRAYFGEWVEMFDGFEATGDEVTDAGDGKVIVRWRVSGTAKASRVPTELVVFMALWLRDGKIRRSREYLTHEEAAAALRG